ncbi:hypothetical protein SCHPADRAFT_948279 [Schizopora paradoxa]|uniref:DUF6532 domain-containing protein n=1 Tax=Schizopora paradoxa TaxID=27342 RepID=A0A0H2QW68_9AGAM|nr:hypothetical protein SCHPADRAFT_948279 [Schizopora paradoxa]
MMRLYLLLRNGYPQAGQLYKCAKIIYRAACRAKYGKSWKDKMPQFTEGMSKLLRDENWGMRGKIKKAALGVVNCAYGLHPDDSFFSAPDSKTLKQMKRDYIAKKVDRLLGLDAPFLRGPRSKKYPLGVAFANPAIKDLIHLLVFNPKRRSPMASKDLNAFEGIPLPLIAYTATALCYGLEEWRTGEHISKTFSESTYRQYYRELLQSLREMEVEQRSVLNTIRTHIFDTGKSHMEGYVTDADKRNVPFKSSGTAPIEMESDSDGFDPELLSQEEDSDPNSEDGEDSEEDSELESEEGDESDRNGGYDYGQESVSDEDEIRNNHHDGRRWQRRSESREL